MGFQNIATECAKKISVLSFPHIIHRKRIHALQFRRNDLRVLILRDNNFWKRSQEKSVNIYFIFFFRKNCPDCVLDIIRGVKNENSSISYTALRPIYM